jgi:hypothetical protein
MESRHIAIAAAAVVGAFVGTFGIGKLVSGGDAATPSSGQAPPSFEVSSAKVSADAPSAGLPDLKAKPKPKATATPTPTTPSATATAVPTAVPTAAPPVTGGNSGGSGETPVTGGGQG